MLNKDYHIGNRTLLHTPSNKVHKFQDVTEEVELLFKLMYEGVKHPTIKRRYIRGVGLAANQVGLNMRMFVVDDGYGFKHCFINPVVKAIGVRTAMSREGCLSYPDKHIDVTRPKFITIEGYNEKWEYLCYKKLRGQRAVLVQHENDHLNGKTIFL